MEKNGSYETSSANIPSARTITFINDLTQDDEPRPCDRREAIHVLEGQKTEFSNSFDQIMNRASGIQPDSRCIASSGLTNVVKTQTATGEGIPQHRIVSLEDSVDDPGSNSAMEIPRSEELEKKKGRVGSFDAENATIDRNPTQTKSLTVGGLEKSGWSSTEARRAAEGNDRIDSPNSKRARSPLGVNTDDQEARMDSKKARTSIQNNSKDEVLRVPSTCNAAPSECKSKVDGPPNAAFSDHVPSKGLTMDDTTPAVVLGNSPTLEHKQETKPACPGVFDDADEDETFDLTAYKKADLVAPPSSIRPDLVAAILGSPVKSTPVSTAQNQPTVVDSKPRATKKKIDRKAIRKTYIAKKEQEAARELLTGKIDLQKILPPRDSLFLGEKVWIFTLQQLESALVETTEGSDVVTPDTNSQGRRDLRKELLNKVLESKFYEDPHSDDNEQHNLKMAEAKLSEWMHAAKSWREKNMVDARFFDPNQFPLDGPLACLFPRCTLNFAISADITTAFDFLSLKRTETGAIVDMYSLWRQHCGLKKVDTPPLAKHISGIGSRLEIGIGTLPHSDSETRSWMGGAMIVLSGAAKDFVIEDAKIHSADDFVERRTKELADMLVEWRVSKGLQPLKGTGKVAMISAWKALVKEEMDIGMGEGSIVTGVDFKKEVERRDPDMPRDPDRPRARKPPPEAVKQPVTPKQKQRKQNASVEDALTSPVFLSSVFKRDKVTLMNSVGIYTAQQLLEAEKRTDSDLVKAIIQMRGQNEMSGASLEPASCVRLVYEWCVTLKKRLDENENTIENRNMSDRPPKAAKLTAESNSSVSVAPRRSAVSKDPFESLSSTCKTFLASIGIENAEAFLSARTTDVANSFIKWRKDRNMSELKGLGAVASISGWKAQVRKTAKNTGQEALAALQPSENSLPRSTSEWKDDVASNLKESVVQEVTDSSVLNGSPKKTFSVAGAFGNRLYHFELSVRKCAYTKCTNALFLTFVGIGHHEKTPEDVRYIQCGFEHERDQVIYPVLKEIKGQSTTPKIPGMFSSSFPKCGVIELTDYDIQPIPPGEINNFQSCLLQFVCEEVSSRKQNRCNVFERLGNGKPRKKEYYAIINNPIEKGQTVQLTFCSGSIQGCAPAKRQMIEEQISQMSHTDLRSLLDFLNKEIGASIYRRMHVIFEAPSSKDFDKETSISSVTDLVRSRRRMHWVALRINTQLQNSMEHCSSMTAPLWTKKLVDSLMKHPSWSLGVRNALLKEVEQEIFAEFGSTEAGNFISSRKVWCLSAERLFCRVMELLVAFNIELDCFLSVDKLIDELSQYVADATMKLKAVAASAVLQDPSKFTEIILTYPKVFLHNSDALPSFEELKRPHFTHICDEESSETPEDVVRVVVTKDLGTSKSSGGTTRNQLDEREEIRKLATCPTESNDQDISFQEEGTPSHDDVGPRNTCGEEGGMTEGMPSTSPKGTAESEQAEPFVIDVQWYIQRQILAVVDAVALGGLANLATHGGLSSLKDMRSRIIEAAASASGDDTLRAISLGPRYDHIKLPSALMNKTFSTCQPDSSAFFLGLVWPVLKLSGWKLEVGDDDPSTVTFFPPGRRKTAKHRILKQEATRRRAELSGKTNALGLGSVQKKMKRLVINCATLDDDGDESGGMPVSNILYKFYQSVIEKLKDDEAAQKKVKKIMRAVQFCFEQLAPNLLYEGEASKYELVEGKHWRDILKCEHLMRFLFLAPNVLQQSDLTVTQVAETIGVIREIMNYLVDTHERLFDSSFHLPFEDYEDDTPRSDFFVSRTKTAKQPKRDTKGDQTRNIQMENTREVVLPSDAPKLTDFVGLVMGQTVICRATVADTHRKRTRVQVGHPGIMCRHCRGQEGDGKYFFSSVESLNTATTVMEKHIAKCQQISPELKDRMVRCRERHVEQRKQLALGAQAAFYARVWERLRVTSSSPTASYESDMCVTLSTSSGGLGGGSLDKEVDSTRSENGLEFQRHNDILTHLQTTSPWKERKEVRDAVDKYYKALEYGGRIYNTDAMPDHFSSEWLLAKINPRKQ